MVRLRRMRIGCVGAVALRSRTRTTHSAADDDMTLNHNLRDEIVSIVTNGFISDATPHLIVQEYMCTATHFVRAAQALFGWR